ncbi:CPBP family intramembrane glutamic endopeptidase [Nocardiopsis ansamitocini]|uniref:CAAX prenyl protease 2/Lysostaphin resistance protein A-like domain-containing protein n=1 Tax=Nocardiopsis ansamitocini TaxID=1670832 RepID=A0A9W6UIB9_9ACTN|nr:type II CAAX endopeptidase family protein [Nocardiopsis ansamitocini]GLU47537.1 hypothetical protein Nans01_18880 [Nocardiopsis ansamitocini]
MENALAGRLPRALVVCLGLVVFLVSAVYLYSVGSTRIRGTDDFSSGELWTLWLPVAVTMLCVRFIPWRRPPDDDLIGQVGHMFRGRRVDQEVVVLLACLFGFFVGDGFLEFAFRTMSPGLSGLAYHTAKVVFLLILPLILIGGSGIMRHVSGPDLMTLATRVPLGWRWAGLVGVLAYLYLNVFLRWTTAAVGEERIPQGYSLLLGLLLTIATSALLQEFFFRVLLQTRVEALLGRWPAIVATALLCAAAELVGAGFVPSVSEELAMTAAVTVPVGLMYGYLWSRYRNIWLNFLLHGGVSCLVLFPALQGTVL